MLPLMISEVILYFLKNLPIDNINVSIHINQNRFINECAKKKKAKIQ